MAFGEGLVLGGAVGGGGGGSPGAPGAPGANGWSPVLANVVDGERVVEQVVNWTGGSGTKPATGKYVGATGLVTLIADAVDKRGATGAASTVPGPKGDPGDASTVPGPKGDKGDPGDDSTVPGPKGDPGTQLFATSNAAPSNALGVNGDYAIDDTTHLVYKKAGGSWSVFTNLHGVRGPQAAGGPSDPPGVSGQEIVGDSWTNQLTWHVFVFNGTTWLDLGTIKGADGAPGANGASAWTMVPAVVTDGVRRVLQAADWTGGSGAKPTTGQYLGSTGLTSTLANGIDIRGAAGTDGTNGADGKTVLTTSGAPSNATGTNGDFAYDPAAKIMYGPKAAGAWPAGVSLAGTDGTNGTNGNTVLSTTGAPASGTGVNGDFAYDAAAKTMYGPKAAGAWPAGVVLAGVTGATGEKGWSPLLALVQDNTTTPYRIVLEVVDWTGGAGTKPATGQYIGPTGLVSTIAAASDIRGDAGAAGQGVPTGGTAGQVLAKVDGTNYNTAWVNQSGGRTVLTADTTFYVRTDGNDSNTGTANTSGGACLTLQGMYNKLLRGYDLAGYTATIQIGAGTYNGAFLATAPVPGGLVVFIGDTTTPSNVVLSASGANAFEVTNGVCNIALKGVKVTTTSSGSGVRASNGAQLNIYNMDFGACVTYQIRADYGGQVLPQTSYTISGGASAHWFAGQGGGITVASKTVTVTGTPAFSTAFAVAQNLSFMAVTGNTYSGSANATGSRYNVSGNSIINTGGQATTVFPGSTNGTTPNGGLYF